MAKKCPEHLTLWLWPAQTQLSAPGSGLQYVIVAINEIDLRIVTENCNLTSQLVRQPTIVGIEESNQFAMCIADCGIAGSPQRYRLLTAEVMQLFPIVSCDGFGQ